MVAVAEIIFPSAFGARRLVELELDTPRNSAECRSSADGSPCSPTDACWRQLRASAEEVSGLKSFSMLYEDEDGDLRVLSQETVEDLRWVASNSFQRRARLTVQATDSKSSADADADTSDRCPDLLRICSAYEGSSGCTPDDDDECAEASQGSTYCESENSPRESMKSSPEAADALDDDVLFSWDW